MEGESQNGNFPKWEKLACSMTLRLVKLLALFQIAGFGQFFEKVRLEILDEVPDLAESVAQSVERDVAAYFGEARFEA